MIHFQKEVYINSFLFGTGIQNAMEHDSNHLFYLFQSRLHFKLRTFFQCSLTCLIISWTRLEQTEFTDALEICIDVVVSVEEKNKLVPKIRKRFFGKRRISINDFFLWNLCFLQKLIIVLRMELN